jgi:phospholipid/cholesterol/gamma-HCH transport system substrate-binding protein
LQGKIETYVGLFVIAAFGIFFYMGFRIGAFRFDRGDYNTYVMYFSDISGLSRKADVKIAGVKVGWVEAVALVEGKTLRAKAEVMVDKHYVLYDDAYPIVRQDGLLGPKFIELIPGDPLLRKVTSGDTLLQPSVDAVNIDKILHQVKDITQNVSDVSESLQGSFGTPEGKEQLKSIVQNLDYTVQKLSTFAQNIDQMVGRNQDNIDVFFEIGKHIRDLSYKLQDDLVPSLHEGIDRIVSVVDRDFGRVAQKIDETVSSFQEASIQVRDSLRAVSSVAEKIDEGKGLIGKLINEDETYRDLKVAVQGFKNYLTKLDRIQIVFDSHFETMNRPAEHYRHEDTKGYFDVRIHPTQDYFYLLQLVTSEKGFIDRYTERRSYENNNGEPIDTNALTLRDVDRLWFVEQANIQTTRRQTFKLGLQFGKIFKDIAIRFGLFEGSAGVGCDIDIPFKNDKFRWVTTLEVFDMRGWNRTHDRRPHLKWLNKMYVMRNIYLTFGADDFVSKHNTNAFFGGGIRFGDDDFKYILSSLSGASGAGSALR